MKECCSIINSKSSGKAHYITILVKPLGRKNELSEFFLSDYSIKLCENLQHIIELAKVFDEISHGTFEISVLHSRSSLAVYPILPARQTVEIV